MVGMAAGRTIKRSVVMLVCPVFWIQRWDSVSKAKRFSILEPMQPHVVDDAADKFLSILMFSKLVCPCGLLYRTNE